MTDFLFWPNGEGETECTEEYRRAYDAMEDAQRAYADDDTAAVYALREPLVQSCPELTIDRVIADYTVSARTRGAEYQEAETLMYALSDNRTSARHRVAFQFSRAGQPDSFYAVY